jgi:hypothetical protein
MKLSEALAQVPVSVLVAGKGDERHGDYPSTFKYVAPLILQDAGVKYDQKTLDAIAEHINLSSFQRSAANEMAKHLGKFDRKKGKRLEPEGRKAKPKKTGVRAIDGKPAPRLDPITGEPAKKAAKGKKAAKAPKVEKPAKPAAKSAKGKVGKKTAPAKEVDPITGEPV